MAGRGLDGGNPAASHARKGAPGPETRSLLERWHVTLRAELEDVLAELRPPPVPSTFVIGDPIPRTRPDLATRARLIDLGVRIAHELGTELDQSERPWSGLEPARRRPRARVDYGPELSGSALADTAPGKRSR